MKYQNCCSPTFAKPVAFIIDHSNTQIFSTNHESVARELSKSWGRPGFWKVKARKEGATSNP